MLRLYEDSSGSTEVTTDVVRKATESGTNMVSEKKLYILSDNTNKTYENVSLTALNDIDGTTTSGEIDYLYAPDNSGSSGTYVQTLSLSNGDYGTATAIWRKAVAPNVVSAFKNTVIEHEMNFDGYIK